MNNISLSAFPDLPFEVTEALNQLRVNIDLCGADIKVIMITSSVPNEGKSFISICLWKMFAELGLKSLLIDCDLRNSEMRSKYGIRFEGAKEGLAHYLAGRIDLSAAICTTNIPYGCILPVEGTLPNPTILLEGDLFKQMIEACRRAFDIIILDTPPLSNVADAMKIATQCDGSVLVVRSNSTPRNMVINSLQQLRRTTTPVLGTVLSRVNTSSKKNSYYNRYYRYGYGNKYGYGYGSNTKTK